MEEPIRVIVVDDEPETTDLLRRVLGSAGIWIVVVYHSAEELLRAKNTQAYLKADVLVIDVQLPKMTGVELAAELRQAGEKRPLIAVSAWSKRRGWSLDDMDVAYLQKPFEFEELEMLIRDSVAG